jgi:hypothetical protein
MRSGLNRHRALDRPFGMIFFGKPLRTSPDHALAGATDCADTN